MLKNLLFILLISFILPCLGQNQQVFNRTYNNSNSRIGGVHLFNNDATFCLTVSDNYYVIGGESENYLWSADSNVIYEAFYLKIDLLGDTIWQNSFNVVNEGIENVSAIIEQSDKSLLFSGAIGDSLLTLDQDYEALLFKTDSLGNIIWYNTYNYLETDIIKDMIYNSGYIYTLSVSAQYSSFFKAFPCLSKMDSLGNILWEICLGDSINKPLGAGSFESINNDFYIPTTVNDFINDSTRLGLTIIDSMGELVDTFQYYNNNNIAGGSHGNMGHYIDENGLHIIMTGQIELTPNNQAAYVMSIDENYNKEWERIIDAGPGNELFISCQVLSDGRIVAISYRNEYESPNPNGSTDELCWLVMLDKYGNTIWERYINAYDEDFSYTYPYQIKTAQDGGFAITGYVINNQIQSNGTFHRNDAWLCKTDSCGFTVGAQPQALLTIDSIVGAQVYISNLSEDYCIGNLNIALYNPNTGDTNLLDSLHVYAYSQFTNGDDPTQIVYTLPDTGTFVFSLSTYAGDGMDFFSTSIQVSDISTGVLSQETNSNFDISIFPNPTKDYIIVNCSPLPSALKNEVLMNVFTTTGQLVKSYTLHPKRYQQRIFLENIANGVYLLNFTLDGRSIGNERLSIVR